MLRKVFGFDHCQKVDALSPTPIEAYDWYTTSGYAISLPAPNASSGYTMNTFISLDGWLAMHTYLISGVGPYTVLNVQAGPSAAKKVVFGARVRTWSSYSHAAYGVMSFFSQGSSEQILFGYDELALVRASNPLPFELYVEVVVDTELNTREVWVNGALWKTAAFTLTAMNKTSIANGTYQLWLRQAIWTGTITTIWQRDIYVCDDVPGDGIVGRLGPQRLIPITVDQASGPWVSDDGLLDLKTTLNAPAPASATLISPTSKEPLTLSLSASIPDGYKVTSMSMWLGGKSLGDIPSTTKLEVKQVGQNLAPVLVSVPRATAYGLPVVQLTQALDGSPLTAAKIDQTTIVVTPDQ